MGCVWRYKLAALVGAMALLGACGGGSSESERTIPEEHVWQDQVDALDKARGVEETLQNAAEAGDAQIP